MRREVHTCRHSGKRRHHITFTYQSTQFGFGVLMLFTVLLLCQIIDKNKKFIIENFLMSSTSVDEKVEIGFFFSWSELRTTEVWRSSAFPDEIPFYKFCTFLPICWRMCHKSNFTIRFPFPAVEDWNEDKKFGICSIPFRFHFLLFTHSGVRKRKIYFLRENRFQMIGSCRGARKKVSMKNFLKFQLRLLVAHKNFYSHSNKFFRLSVVNKREQLELRESEKSLSKLKKQDKVVIFHFKPFSSFIIFLHSAHLFLQFHKIWTEKNSHLFDIQIFQL